MQNCSSDLIAFHDAEVTLPQSERDNMRNRRNANRDRLVSRFKADAKATPKFVKQGSYAMLTMIQDVDNDYDIDDGVYFNEKDLNQKSPVDIKKEVCEALKDDRFKRQPNIKPSCVRIYYNEGYHVDMPIYRVKASDGDNELAQGDEWVISRASDVEAWFNNENDEKSPDEKNGRQFRRIVRFLKKFARSRKDWKKTNAAGFTITKLISEKFVPYANREDESLYGTMKAIHNRLLANLEVEHPVTPHSMLTKGSEDPRTMFLRDRLGEAIDTLKILDDPECSREAALNAWGKAFNTDFFKSRPAEERSSGSNNTSKLAALALSVAGDPPPVDKQGGGRFA